MGYGLPAAIGAQFAFPDDLVICVTGDGSYQMCIQELATIRQYNLGVKIVLLNNSFLGMVRQWQELFHEKRYSSTELANPDFVKLVQAYGLPAKKATRREELAPLLKEMLESKTACFLEVEVGKEDNVFPMIPAGAGVSDVMLEKE